MAAAGTSIPVEVALNIGQSLRAGRSVVSIVDWRAMAGATIFRAARVWDGVSDSVLLNGFVLVEGDRIVAVGPWSEDRAATPSSVQAETASVLDCGDVTLMPGLINSHVHLTLSASMNVLDDYLSERERGVAALIDRALDNLSAAVFAGVTTVRDCGTLNEVAFTVRHAVESGEVVGPRVLTCGSGLTTPGGHCHFFCLEVDTIEALRGAVVAQARAGADFIKVFATGGNLTPGTNPFAPQYSADELRAVVDAAHDAGLRVAAHAHAPEGIANAVVAGVDTIEHCFFETEEGIAYDERLVDLIAGRGIMVCPTVGARQPMAAEEIAALLETRPQARRLMDRMAEIRANFLRMFDSGVCLAAGNDAGAIPGFDFGNYPMAVGAMADGWQFPVGLSAIDALRSATSVAAVACGATDTGRLAPGLRADLLAVDGNPLDQIAALEQVRLVVCDGKIVVEPNVR
jgi:imidazolonepropionase-like amidohydrolase